MNDTTTKDVAYVTPLKKICMTIGELPSSYLETMSYYEMLVWFTEFLKNQVIPTVNNNAEAVQELQTLYEQLRSYVENYFDNLDVQEEIDNKLDEMSESGELTDIIAQYLGLAGMFTFNTVSDMKLAENLVNGSKCTTFGYHSINDGGKANYNIRYVTNEDTIDEANIIALHDNLLVAEIVFDNNVTPEQMGAYGDGTNNDTQAIQRAIDTNHDVFFDNIYSVNNELNLSTYSHLIFSKKAKILFSGQNACFHGLSCEFVKLENIRIESTNRTGIGILLEKARNCEIFSPYLVNLSTGIKIDGLDQWSASNNIYNPFIYKFNIGIHLTANSGKQTNDTKVIGGYIIDEIREITTQYSESCCVRNDASCDTNIFIGVATEDADVGFYNASTVSTSPMSLICCRSENMTSYYFKNTGSCRNIYTYGCNFKYGDPKVSVDYLWNQQIDSKNISSAYLGGPSYTDEIIDYFDSGHSKRRMLQIETDGILFGPSSGVKQKVKIRGTSQGQSPTTYIEVGGADGLVFPVKGFVMKSKDSSKMFKITVDDSGNLAATEYTLQD